MALAISFYWCARSQTLTLTVPVTESETENKLSTDRKKTAPFLPTQIHKMTDPTTQQRSYPSRQASSLGCVPDLIKTIGKIVL
jgi:hypothetical protein